MRETLAITAYATGDFALALRELRTYRRISGRDDQLPLMVDSERGIGRPDRALELGRSVDRATLPASVQADLAIAMSGARLDLGQTEEALAELEIPQLDPDRAFSYSPALFAAYAEVLGELGRDRDAEAWRARALRAEAALEAPFAESELITVIETEDEDFIETDVVEVDAVFETEADATVEDVPSEDASIEKASLDGEPADAERTDAGEAQRTEDGEDAGGALPSED